MGRLLGLGFQSQPDNFSHFFIADSSRSTTAWQVDNACDPSLVKALAQTPDGVRAKTGLFADLGVIQTIGTSQNGSRSQRFSLRSFGTTTDGLELLAFLCG